MDISHLTYNELRTRYTPTYKIPDKPRKITESDIRLLVSFGHVREDIMRQQEEKEREWLDHVDIHRKKRDELTQLFIEDMAETFEADPRVVKVLHGHVCSKDFGDIFHDVHDLLGLVDNLDKLRTSK